jgi:ribosomal protein S7
MNRGGKREGAGRPTKVDEHKANVIFLNALKTVYNSDTEQQAKEKFVIDLMKDYRGKHFVAEHIFGKANTILDLNTTEVVKQQILSVNPLIDDTEYTP